MHQFDEIDEQVRRALAEAVTKPLRADSRDPVKHGDATGLEIAGLVVVRRQERRDIGFMRRRQRPLRRHIGSIDAELERGEAVALGGLARNGRAPRREDGPARTGERRLGLAAWRRHIWS